MNVQAFLNSLPIMLYGMGGIFIVTVLVFVCIKILTKLFPEKEES